MISARFLLVLVLCTSAAGAQPIHVLDSTLNALGGKDHVMAARSLIIEATGSSYNFGQGRSPDAALPRFEVSALRRSINLSHEQHRLEMTRTPTFITAVTTPQQLIWGLDGDIAYTVAPSGQTSRQPDAIAEGRRHEHYHHPLVLLHAALQPGNGVTVVSGSGHWLLRVHIPPHDRFELWIHKRTYLPAAIRSTRYDVNLGDVLYETRYDHYQQSGALRLPTRLTSHYASALIAQYDVQRNIVSDTSLDLAAPSAARGPAPVPSVSVVAEELAPGVWYLTGGSHHSVLVEFERHLMLIETPQNDARTLAVFAKARELRPGKPIRYAVTTHHHHDHSGGVRAAMSESATIVTHSGNVRFFYDVARRKHSLQRDAQARADRYVKIEGVRTKRVFRDRTRTVELHHLRGNPHSETMLVAYLPADRLLVQADAFTPPAPNAPPPPSFPFATHLVGTMKRLGLVVERVVPLHGRVVPFAELEEAAK